jgi:small-conductance mechanosensitive channel
MKTVRRILGVLWLLLAALAAYFCVVEFGLPKFATGKQDDLVFGIIILFVLTPLIVLGLAVFGYYALTGEYDD